MKLFIPWIIKTLVALGVFTGKAILQFLRTYMAQVAGWGVVAEVRKYL